MKVISICKWLYATSIIIIGALLMIIFFPILNSPKSQKTLAKFISYFTRIQPIVEGKEDSEANMFLINHESDLDVGHIEYITNAHITWIAKIQLFKIPIFGLVLKLPKNIAVERESKTSLLKLIKDSKEKIKEKKTLAIFPEGTRSSTGKMRKFKPGAKIVADKLKLCVQPIVIINSASYYDLQKKYFKSGKIKIIYLNSFYADKNDKEWLNKTREQMQKVYDKELKNISKYR